jgi:hypothetical protein
MSQKNWDIDEVGVGFGSYVLDIIPILASCDAGVSKIGAKTGWIF